MLTLRTSITGMTFAPRPSDRSQREKQHLEAWQAKLEADYRYEQKIWLAEVP